MINGRDGINFSSTNQPTPAAKANGVLKKKFIRLVLAELLGMQYKFIPNSQIKKQLIAAFGQDVLKMNVGQVMGLQQAQKAILKGDTFAFTQLMNQALGLPTISAEITGKDGKDLAPLVFLSADKLTDEQLEKYLSQNNGG